MTNQEVREFVSQEMDRLLTENAKLKKANAKLQAQVRRLRDHRSALCDERRALKTRLNKCESDYAELVSGGRNPEIDRLRQALEGRQAEIGNLSQALKKAGDAQQRCEGLEAMLNAVALHKEDLSKELVELKEALKVLAE